MKKTNVLCIMDGFGHNPSDYGNAIVAAKKPNLDMLMEKYPYTYIGASGMDVGLPDGQMGNSEVGHTNMGAGRVVYQELTRITKSIQDGDFFENEVLVNAIKKSVDAGTSLHLMGLMSDGGVHSHNTHAWAIVELAKRLGQNKVYLHCIMDGRDVPPTSGKDFVADAIEEMNKIGVGKVATVVGRYYAMDRDSNFDRVQKAYNALVFGEGIQNTDPVAAIEESYNTIDGDGKNLTDEFIMPTVCLENEGRIGKDDSVIFFNFRPDRAREITRTFVDKDFKGFDREFFNLNYVCMTQYDATMPNVEVAFKPQSLTNTFGEYLAKNDMTQ
ncbi:MAG: 2,3-bisphosphoglycerate-independent phosphoglycerate mutase, partial [Ruminococcaceae bacterium]|nr:2,3-bisphosphoglycerate-independent phosphoglycerate mutase [Oscillospiraceae bacterium]